MLRGGPEAGILAAQAVQADPLDCLYGIDVDHLKRRVVRSPRMGH
jgi:hypothetical protein